MSQAEYDAMRASGKVQEGLSGTTHVASQGDALAFINQALPGSVHVEFNVPFPFAQSNERKLVQSHWSKFSRGTDRGPEGLADSANAGGNRYRSLGNQANPDWRNHVEFVCCLGEAGRRQPICRALKRTPRKARRRTTRLRDWI